MSLRGLNGKVAIVAGGATGIGAATARRLAAEGVSVLIGDIAVETAVDTAERIRADGGTASAAWFDLADADSISTLTEVAITEYGGVDLLFNVGSDMSLLSGDTDVIGIDLDLWDRTMTVTPRGYLLTMRSVIPTMLARGGGAIVNMSSAAAFQGDPVRPAYSAAKAAVGALTRHVAAKWGRERIRCNAVAPGLVATAAIRSAPQFTQLEQAALTRMRSDRVGDPEDIAAMVAFLMSDEGSWINGQVISIDGGAVLR